jgi:macrolide transport system ATP-binding/permease protein
VLLAFLNRTTPAIHQLHIGIDWHVLSFIAALAALSVLLFGTAPAVQASRAASPGSSSAGNTRAGSGLRKTFVVAQIALSFLVVLAAGLFAQTLRHLATLELGYVPDEIAAMDIRPASGGYAGDRANRFYKQLVEHLRATPGVKAAATALGPHIEGGVKMTIQAQTGQSRYEANLLAVSPGYFGTFGARILAGTDFDPADRRRRLHHQRASGAVLFPWAPGRRQLPAAGRQKNAGRGRRFQHSRCKPARRLARYGVSKR